MKARKAYVLATLLVVAMLAMGLFASLALAQSPVETPTPQITELPPTVAPSVTPVVATATPVPVPPPPPPPPGPLPVDLSPALITTVLAGALSLLLKYVPGLRVKWAELIDDQKQLIFAIAAIVIGVVVYVLACTPGTGFPFVACPVGGIWALFATLVATLITGFGLNGALPDVPSVKEAKLRSKAKKAQRGL